MVIGAGTVLTAEQAKLAQQAGAAFFVTPNTKEEMIRFANAHDIATVIGAMTATECQQAHEWGADFVKLFPSETMGAAYLKACLLYTSDRRLRRTLQRGRNPIWQGYRPRTM